jgi:hypothetical protein
MQAQSERRHFVFPHVLRYMEQLLDVIELAAHVVVLQQLYKAPALHVLWSESGELGLPLEQTARREFGVRQADIEYDVRGGFLDVLRT